MTHLKRCTVFLILTLVAVGSSVKPLFAKPIYEVEAVFDPGAGEHGHVHASCIVECPSGDIRVVWYENGTPLPEPAFNKNKDKSDDVRIGGARKPAGSSAWEPTFVMADSFGVSDNNPCMVIDKKGRLWLFHVTLLGVPESAWGSALLRYQISSDYHKPGPPTWQKSDVLIPHPQGIEAVLETSFAARASQPEAVSDRMKEIHAILKERLHQPLMTRLGWMPRAHPIVRSDGTLILPLSNENFDLAAMAMTSDGGETWTLSKLVPEFGLTQPTLVEFPGGKISAFFRNGDPRHRIKRSDSVDGGLTWGEVKITSLLHPGAGIEALRLRNGHLLMVYNDKEQGARDRLAVSISRDDGETWTWTRHLENVPEARFDYPSIIQSKDDTLHVTYSDNLKTIKHVRFNEEWVQEAK